MGGVLDIIASGKLTGPSFLDSQEQQARIAQEQALTQHTLQQSELGKQQVVGAGLQNQLIQRDMADQDILRRALMSTDQSIPAMRSYAIKNGVSVPGLLKWQAGMLDLSTKAATLTKEQREDEIKTNGEVQDILTGIVNDPSAYPTAYKRLAALAPPGTFPESLPDDSAQAKDMLAHMAAAAGAHAKLLSQQEAAAKIEQTGAQTAEARATTGKTIQATREAKIQQAAQELAAAPTPNDYVRGLARLDTDVAALFPSPAQVYDSNGRPIPEGIARVRALGMTPEQQTTAEQTAARNAATIANEKLMRQQEGQRIGLEAGRLGIERAKNAREQQIYEQTYGAGANQALVGVDPKLRIAAMKDAQKAADDYLKASETESNLNSMLQLIRSGNKAAGSNLPLLGVEALNALQGIKRINKTELETYAGAGSLLDRIQGKIGKLVAGKPIDAAVLKDIEDMHNLLASNSSKAYNDKLAGINQNYKSHFEPVKGASPAAAAPQFKVGDMVMYNGKQHKVSAVDPQTGKLTLEP